jgi:aryl carrier-like protein
VALAGVADAAHTGRGLSAAILRTFKALAAALGLERVIVPVRPTGKVDSLDVSFEAYCRQLRPDGLPLDNWLRAHARLGGRTLRIDTRSQHVVGTLAEWRRWTGLALERSGRYQVEGALQPVAIDVDANLGEYFDPSVWIEHDLAIPGAPTLQHLDAHELRSFLRSSLPDYMVPDHVQFLLSMPLSHNGKIDEKALPRVGPGSTRARALIPPENEAQASLLRLWRDLLQSEAIGVTDNFFDVGGHSMLAIRFLARLRDELGKELPLGTLYRHPTICELETLLRSPTGTGEASDG